MRWIELALFTTALLLAGLVVPALLWSGEEPYLDLARDNGVTRYVFVLPAEGRWEMGLDGGVALHGQWSRYVTGATAEPPRPAQAPLFTDDEYAHMADVRGVFEVAKFLVPVALFVMVIRLQRARQRGGRAMWQLVRDGAAAAALVVAAVGALALVAFEPLFLAFHRIFFPQGNFLFDPATSNLIRLYPDWYWQGISLRVGGTCIALALGLAAIAQWRLRSAK